MWVKISVVWQCSIFFSVKESGSTNKAFQIGRIDSNKITFSFHGDGGTNPNSSTSITDNNWHHYVFTYNVSNNVWNIYQWFIRCHTYGVWFS